MMSPKKDEHYAELRASLEALPHVSPAQVETWVELQQSIDNTRDYLIRAVPDAQFSIDEAQKILGQRTYTLVFFGGTGVGKSTLARRLAEHLGLDGDLKRRLEADALSNQPA